jgi:hypothetical protein
LNIANNPVGSGSSFFLLFLGSASFLESFGGSFFSSFGGSATAAAGGGLSSFFGSSF